MNLSRFQNHFQLFAVLFVIVCSSPYYSTASIGYQAAPHCAIAFKLISSRRLTNIVHLIDCFTTATGTTVQVTLIASGRKQTSLSFDNCSGYKTSLFEVDQENR